MRWITLILAAGLLLTACSGLPRIHPTAESAAAENAANCPNPFPAGKWQFVHSIQAFVGGGSAFVTGVAVVSSRDRTFRCVILTLEGLTVFDAEWDRWLTVHRAIAPFDSKPFAEGLADDIRLLFFKPQGSPIETGFLSKGDFVCRYKEPDGGFLDLVSQADGNGEIRRYSSDLRLLRSVRLIHGREKGAAGIPSKIELTAHGDQKYRMVMDLVEAVSLQ